MAASTVAARRYAEALFAAARDTNEVDAVERDLLTIDALVRRTPQVLELMRNPLLPAARKQEILTKVLGESVTPLTLRFLQILVQKRRSEVLPDVHGLFTELANQFRRIVPAHVTSAKPLTPDEESALVERLTAWVGKQVVLRTDVNPKLIGGVRVRIGDTVMDGSAVGYLRQLREQLRKTLV